MENAGWIPEQWLSRQRKLGILLGRLKPALIITHVYTETMLLPMLHI